jgi:response regulator RpfG family c-di-GMP phosphodiesterase
VITRQDPGFAVLLDAARDAFRVERAVGIMWEGSGSQFDPQLVSQFLDHADEAVAILGEYPDV